VWNDAACLRHLLELLKGEPGPIEIIVINGQSTDGTAEVASKYGVRLLSVPRGRGRQMNAGARAARGETLLFLHCDTVPSFGAIAGLPDLLQSSGADFRAFRLRFDPPCLLPTLLALFTWFALPWTCFGDQGIFVDRQFFRKTGGFPEIPALEDVHWLRTIAERRWDGAGVGRFLCALSAIAGRSRRWADRHAAGSGCGVGQQHPGRRARSR
jgi:glycosyltransferase involved in cell wall biosynthesis